MRSPAILAIFISLAAPSCAKPAASPVGTSAVPQRAPEPTSTQEAPYPLLSSALVARLGPSAQGPYLATANDGAMSVFATAVEGGEAAWWATALSDIGEPKASPTKIAPASNGATATVLRRLGANGYVLVVARTTDRGNVVEATAIAKDATSKSGVVVLRETADPIVWADAVPTPSGAHVTLATKIGEDVRIEVVPLDANGAVRHPPVVVATAARAWQTAPTARGSLLLTVQPTPKGSPQVLATPIAEDGTPGAPQVVGEGADLDVDAASFGDRVVVGWTDRAGPDAHVRLATIDPSGKTLVPPSTPLLSAGEQALVGLAAHPAEHGAAVLVAWDDLAVRTRRGRHVRITSFSPDMKVVHGRGTLEPAPTEDPVAPTIASGPEGFAALVLAPACAREAPCDDAPVVPTFVRLSTDLDVRATGPLFPSKLAGRAPELAWGLGCTGATCLALATGDDGGQSAFVASLEGGERTWRAPATRFSLEKTPRATGAGVVAKGPRVSDLDAARIGSGALVAMVTESVEGGPLPPLPPDVDARAEAEKDRLHKKNPKKGSPRASVVSVLPVDANGVPRDRATTLSIRAATMGGIAIAAANDGKDACAAWVARDDGDPEVFLTRVGPDGKKQAQTMLTHAKGDASDVAIAPLEDGWLVAWVDARDGNGEVYAAKVDHALRKRGPEQRITNAPGDASDVALVVRDKDALVVFSDARAEGNGPAHASPYAARLRLTDAAKIGTEVRLAATQDDARDLHVQRFGPDVLVAWIEQPPGAAVADRPSSLATVLVDSSGASKGASEPIELPTGVSPSSLGIACTPEKCRVAITHAVDDGAVLAAFPWRPGDRTAEPVDLLPLFARGASDVVPTFLGDAILVSDAATPVEGRVRRIVVGW